MIIHISRTDYPRYTLCGLTESQVFDNDELDTALVLSAAGLKWSGSGAEPNCDACVLLRMTVDKKAYTCKCCYREWME